MATLLRKIGLIRLHNHDTEDLKHHHHHYPHGSFPQGSSLWGKSNQKNKAPPPPPLQGMPTSGCGSPSKESCSSSRGSSPTERNKPHRVLEPAQKPPTPPPATTAGAKGSGWEQPSGLLLELSLTSV